MKKHIPNSITLCNLVCGCIAVRYAFVGLLDNALLFILAGAVFDFFDGFAARKLHVSSPLGKELDSLADVITFGFAPAAMVFIVLTSCLHNIANIQLHMAGTQWYSHLNAAAFLIAAFSALRLGKFNLDERQATSFLGLPTPANALLTASFIITLNNNADEIYSLGGALQANIAAVALICAFIAISCILLVSELPLFALKFKTFTYKDNSVRYIFLITSAIILLLAAISGLHYLIMGMGVVILWYIILSLITRPKRK